MSRKGNNILLSWPVGGGSYVLQWTQTLSPAVWADVAIPPTVVNGNYVVSIPVSGAAGFYRLRAQ